MYYDAHNHLQDPALAPHRAAIAQALEALPLGGAVVNGTTEADWPLVTTLARENPRLLPSYGLHPWHLARRTPHWQAHLLAAVEATPACGIGEIGLDRWIPHPDLEDQQTVFLWQYRLATRLNLPASLHCLRAWGPLWELLRDEPPPPRGFLLHAYGGPVEMVEGWARLGAYFSFSGSFLDPRKTAKREVFRHIPPERLLVETDAPAMPLPPALQRHTLPSAEEGTPLNHPANLGVTTEGLATLRGWALPEALARVEENYHRLFGQAP